jgi:hypothetical protein
VALKPVNTKRSSASVPVRWDHLPHDELALEISSRISHRQAHLTDLEVAQKYLRERLKLLILPEHDDYINCVAADLKRELRICRDVYRDYLKVINKKSATDEATTLKQFGTLSRCAKRAFYQAKDAYQRALERVYEQRIPAPIKKNPFESRL